MLYHEREFFISLIRSSKIIIIDQDLKLEIRPLTISQSLEANYIYKDAFEKSYTDELMTEYEMKEWMDHNGLWTIEHENKTEIFKKDLEKFKIEIYQQRHEGKTREQIRKYIRSCEKLLSNHLREKSMYFENTREGYALSEKVSWIIKNTTYHNDVLYDFKDISLNYVTQEWQNSILSETIIRELAREEPWKSLWSIRDNGSIKLYDLQPNEELTQNQKHLILWSQIYDNIQESMECPHENVIKDDDMLDGWFILQSKKRQADKLEQELEHEIKNEKIKNSKEVFVVTRDKDNQRRINSMNDPVAQAIKKQREELIKQKGEVREQDLPDQKLELQLLKNNAERDRVKGAR